MFEKLRTTSNPTEFDLRGNLKSNITFQWLGEVSQVSIREVNTFVDTENPGDKKTTYSVVVSDSFGFEMSFWKRSQGLDAAAIMAQQMPRETIRICGKVRVRKGLTYFNAEYIEWPNGERFLFRNYQQKDTGENEYDLNKDSSRDIEEIQHPEAVLSRKYGAAAPGDTRDGSKE